MPLLSVARICFGGKLRLLMSSGSPYKNVAVASAFSPRFEQVLSEAKRIRDRFGADLSVIYIGAETDETSRKFAKVFKALGLPANSVVHYGSGDAAGGILREISENDVDLVVAGALEKETALHPFLGNVARRLLREASCSVLLFTKPERQPEPLSRIVFVADYSDHGREAFRQMLHFAAEEKCERVYAVRIFTTFDEARASRRAAKSSSKASLSFDQEEEALEKFVLDAGDTEVPIEARCIRGNTGFAASDFVKSVEAKLLVVPVDKIQDSTDRLPKQLAWIADVIPCNLWLIR